MIRSTQSKLEYRGYEFKLFNAPEVIKREVIVIGSRKYGNYVGELQIVLEEMKSTGMSNFVIMKYFFLYYIKHWQKFKFIKKD